MARHRRHLPLLLRRRRRRRLQLQRLRAALHHRLGLDSTRLHQRHLGRGRRVSGGRRPPRHRLWPSRQLRRGQLRLVVAVRPVRRGMSSLAKRHAPASPQQARRHCHHLLAAQLAAVVARPVRQHRRPSLLLLPRLKRGQVHRVAAYPQFLALVARALQRMSWLSLMSFAASLATALPTCTQISSSASPFSPATSSAAMSSCGSPTISSQTPTNT